MAAAQSKRHAARNERALQELLQSDAANNLCADCGARNPGWASWNLGIFLCMRCASLHRKLGTHISKVKSLSMDSWTNEQVENMRKVGNTASNKRFNPTNAKPQVPMDVDEVDAAMERFVRQKYEKRNIGTSNTPRSPVPEQEYRQQEYRHTGSSDDERAPPPPSKSGGRRFWGLRSASSALPLSKKKKEERRREDERRQEDEYQHQRRQDDEYRPERSPPVPRKNSNPPPPIRLDKHSRVFGAAIGLEQEGIEWKLTALKDMGFPDDKRNKDMLKGMNGDLERAIESLIRLGEGKTPSTKSGTPSSARFSGRPATSTTSSAFPEPKFQPRSASITPAAGISFNVPSPVVPQRSMSATDMSSLVSTQQQQQQSYNPFVNSNTSPALPQLETSFQNMQVSQQQPLFPNSTGGYQHSQQYLDHFSPQQTMTPPLMPQIPQQYAQTNPYQTNPYAQQQQQSANFNPFMINTSQNQTPMTPISANPFLQQQFTGQQNVSNQQAYNTSNPFYSQHSQPNMDAALASPQLQQQQFQQPSQTWPQPQQAQQHQQFQQPQQQQLFTPTFSNSPTTYNPMQQFPTQPLVPQQTGRIDKSSILALYNYPQLAPQQPALSGSASNPASGSISPQQPAAVIPDLSRQDRRSVTISMASGSKNPFMSAAPQAAAAPQRPNMISSESSDSGRHSPDAFASLSARFVR